jgi:hypothetical protein
MNYLTEGVCHHRVQLGVTLFKLLLQVSDDLRQERHECFLEYLCGGGVSLDQLPPMIHLHVFMMILQHVKERIHPLSVSDVLGHQLVQLILPLLQGQRIRILRETHGQARLELLGRLYRLRKDLIR